MQSLEAETQITFPSSGHRWQAAVSSPGSFKQSGAAPAESREGGFRCQTHPTSLQRAAMLQPCKQRHIPAPTASLQSLPRQLLPAQLCHARKKQFRQIITLHHSWSTDTVPGTSRVHHPTNDAQRAKRACPRSARKETRSAPCFVKRDTQLTQTLRKDFYPQVKKTFSRSASDGGYYT